MSFVKYCLLLAVFQSYDGDPDIINLSITPSLQVNLHRQIHAPYPARPGHPYRMDFYSQPGHGPGLTALLWISSAPAAPPIPFPGLGTIGIDLGTAALLGAVPIPAAGHVGGELQVPNDPALIGRTFYFQALMGPPDFRLTNVIAETIAPGG